MPVLKVQEFSVEEIFRRKLLFLLPFVIFSYEKMFTIYENNDAKREKLTNIYKTIHGKLNDLEEKEELSTFEKKTICAMSLHVLSLIAKSHPKVKKSVEDTMNGKILDYEAKRIFDEGRTVEREEQKKLLRLQQRNRQKLCFSTRWTLP
ncbi:MAG: hypothetical protein IJU76_01685 [Desulfovibrionaceae bacterium]|nr:hypothetical protein [Desulfovibrionaceae bacterium]